MPINSPNVFTVVGDAFLTGIGGGTGTLSYQLDEYDVSGTWTMPANCIGVEVWLMEAGSGGSSGERQATGVAARGGFGGLSGSQIFAFFLPQQISDIVTVTIGAGGTGGAPVTTDNSVANLGSNGGGTYFGTFFGSEGAQRFAYPKSLIGASQYGNAFPAKDLENTWWGNPSAPDPDYVFGIQLPQAYRTKIFASVRTASNYTGGTSSASSMFPLTTGTIPSGAVGGGITSANVAGLGQGGGLGYNYNDIATSYAGASAPTLTGQNGNSGSDNYTEMYNAGMIMLATNNLGTYKTGQAPSGGSASTTGTGGNGGNGGKYGLGGAGGGSSRNGYDSGAGGAGGQGCLKVLSIILN